MNIFLFYNYLRFDSFRSCFLAYLLGATFCNGFATLSLMQNLSDGRMSGAIPFCRLVYLRTIECAHIHIPDIL